MEATAVAVVAHRSRQDLARKCGNEAVNRMWLTRKRRLSQIFARPCNANPRNASAARRPGDLRSAGIAADFIIYAGCMFMEPAYFRVATAASVKVLSVGYAKVDWACAKYKVCRGA